MKQTRGNGCRPRSARQSPRRTKSGKNGFPGRRHASAEFSTHKAGRRRWTFNTRAVCPASVRTPAHPKLFRTQWACARDTVKVTRGVRSGWVRFGYYEELRRFVFVQLGICFCGNVRANEDRMGWLLRGRGESGISGFLVYLEWEKCSSKNYKYHYKNYYIFRDGGTC